MEVFGHIIDVAKLLDENVGNRQGWRGVERQQGTLGGPPTRQHRKVQRQEQPKVKTVFNHQGDQWCLWVRLEDWVGPAAVRCAERVFSGLPRSALGHWGTGQLHQGDARK